MQVILITTGHLQLLSPVSPSAPSTLKSAGGTCPSWMASAPLDCTNYSSTVKTQHRPTSYMTMRKEPSTVNIFVWFMEAPVHLHTCRSTGKERIDPQHLFTFANPPHELRGHTLKLYKPTVRLNIRKNFFSQRIIDHWNKLNQYVVDAPSTNSFKNRLDKHWSKSDMGI